MAATFVHVDPDSTFACSDQDGSTVEIGSSPVAVTPWVAAYLDTVPYVERGPDLWDPAVDAPAEVPPAFVPAEREDTV